MINVAKLVFFFIICANSVYAQVLCNVKKVLLIEEGNCPVGQFVLTFEDNFDGTNLDTSIWRVKTGVTRDPDQRSANQWFLPENAVVSNGTLKLVAKRDTLINQCFDIWMNDAIGMKRFCKDFYFSAAEIGGKVDFGHGKFEISCKLPRAKGLGSSFWVWTYQNQNEIDVFEFNNENDVFGNFSDKKLSRFHYMNIRTDFEDDGNIEDCSTNYKGPDFSEAFHTFTVIWTPQFIQWYVDGKLKRTSSLFYTALGQVVDCNDLRKDVQYIKNRAFPLHPMHIITSLTTQSGSNSPDPETSLPAEFEIDYIRYYKLQ